MAQSAKDKGHGVERREHSAGRMGQSAMDKARGVAACDEFSRFKAGPVLAR